MDDLTFFASFNKSIIIIRPKIVQVFNNKVYKALVFRVKFTLRHDLKLISSDFGAYDVVKDRLFFELSL